MRLFNIVVDSVPIINQFTGTVPIIEFPFAERHLLDVSPAKLTVIGPWFASLRFYKMVEVQQCRKYWCHYVLFVILRCKLFWKAINNV